MHQNPNFLQAIDGNVKLNFIFNYTKMNMPISSKHYKIHPVRFDGLKFSDHQN